MAIYRVYQVQEQIEIHKWLFEVEADDDDEAIEKAMNGEAKQIEQGKIGEPEYACWGWSARPVGATGDVAWSDAITNLETNRREHW
jgi:hypothetical protein